MIRILIIEEGYDHKLINPIHKKLENNGYFVERIDNFFNGYEILKAKQYDIAIFDYNEKDASNIISAQNEIKSNTKCIIVPSQPNIHDSVSAIKKGAFNYLDNLSIDNVIESIKQALAGIKTVESPKKIKFKNFIGKSTQIVKVFNMIEKVTRSDSTVLITGESGTGKELIARAIHNNSLRCNNPMVIINCGAIPSELLESELFGHEKGSFTGAHKTRMGRFEIANGGTVFLDEIGDMSPNLQVKLLRVLQEQTFERIGGASSIKVDIRVIAATNKDLLNSIEEHKFREDLYYRLNVIPIKVPPLRERKSDIPILIDFFLKNLAERRSQPLKSIDDESMNLLVNYDWPGNVRELENIMERLSVMVEDDIIIKDDVPDNILNYQKAGSAQEIIYNPIKQGISFTDAVEQYQKTLILEALNETNWVKSKAAELLKMNRTTLVEKIKKLKLENPNLNNDE
ncbi:MAG: sigma-54-dependent Fis family transcriptional regulator [Desulfobacterales bacterium]|nr:sigma-54-dependent Fis family transcriptional regulator [Desulfobacterales bacterium]